MIYPDEIIRSNRKTLAISVDSFGRLIVRAPKRYGEERIFAFIQEKEGWIIKKRRELSDSGVCLPPSDLQGYKLLLLGERYTLCLINANTISFDKENKRIYLPAKNAQARLIVWLKENAKRILSVATEELARQMGTSYQKVTVGSARRRWGACTADNRISYSYRLLFAPKEVLEYVVVHELSHTFHKDHSPKFWATVAQLVPDWKTKRQWLHQHRALMELF